MGILLAVYIAVFTGIIMIPIFMGTSILKAIIFSVDKMMIFIISYYFIHNYFSVKVATGNAIHFWNILISLIIVLIYSVLFKMVYHKLGIVGKIINFAISYLGVVAAYYSLTSMFIQDKGFYYIPLLKNQDINKI